MIDERKCIIDEITKEIEEIRSIAMIRFILNITRSYKKGGTA